MKSSVTLSLNQSNVTDYRNVTTIAQRRSDINYLQYINFFEKQHCDFQYHQVSQHKIQKSLNQLRNLMKQFNQLLKKTMHKNYQLLAQFSKELPPTDIQKQIQILKAEIQNSHKVITTQQAQKAYYEKYCNQMENKQDYELQLLKQMDQIKSKMPSIQLTSKHQIGGIQKNSFVLINQEEDQSAYIRLAILRADYQRNGEKLRKLTQRNAQLDQKIINFQQRQYDATARLQKLIQIAKQKSLDVSTNADMAGLKQKCQKLKKKRQQQQKKTALFQHVSNSNEANLRKKIADMKKLQKQYFSKTQVINQKIKKLQQDNQKILKDQKVLKKPPQSLPFRYAQTLLKGDRNKSVGVKNNVLDSQNDKNFQIKQQNNNRVLSKPNMGIKNKISNNKNDKNFLDFQDEEQNINKKSHIFSMKKNSRQNKDQRRKINASLNENLFLQDKKEDAKTPQYRISKPNLNLKRKKQQKSQIIPDNIEETEENIKILPRLNQRRNVKKISDNEMKSLEEKGRKILGL